MRASVLSPPRACSLHRPCLPPALSLVRSLARSFAPALPLVCSLARSFARARALSEAGMPAKCESAWIIPTSQSIQQSSAGRQLSLTGASVRLAVAVLPRQSDIPALRRAARPHRPAAAPAPGHHAQLCAGVLMPGVSPRHGTLHVQAPCVCLLLQDLSQSCSCARFFFIFFSCKPPDTKPPFLAKIAVSNNPI